MISVKKETVSGRIGIITFENSGKKNALCAAMLVPVADAMEEFAGRGASIIIATGSGNAFSTGYDITLLREEFSVQSPTSMNNRTVLQNTIDRIELIPVPTIAMIHGYCIGGGFELASSFDFRIASSETIFGIPVARMGLVYPHTGVSRIEKILGRPFTREMLLTGLLYDAEVMFKKNFLNRVTDIKNLRDETMKLADILSENSQVSLRGLKTVFRGLDTGLSDKGFTELVEASLASGDIRESVKAFSEKRKPEFRHQLITDE